MKTIRLALAAGAVLAAGCAFAALSPRESEQKCTCAAASQQASEPDKRGTESSPLSVKLLNTGESDREASEKSEGIKRTEKTERWTIRLTVALVVATLLQFGALLWQGRELKSQIALGQAEFVASHRPRLVVRQIEYFGLDVTDPNHPRMQLRCAIANVGDGQGHLVDSRYHVEFSDGEKFNPIEEGDTFGIQTVAPGGEVRVSMALKMDLASAVAMAALESGASTRAPYFRGFLYYTDENKVARRTYFSRAYSKGTGRFVLTNDPDYDQSP